ncbi:Transcription factor bHLH146 [Hirschfeldia incana]|nr:Transcription factor bHLH146 [Hirschfeldia incana]
MERQIINKKKRVFSVEPNKVPPSEVFTRKYTSHLVPALKKLNMNKNSSQINQLTVKHEVDMALALSAQEFAWSRFLLQKLSSSNNPTTTTSSLSIGIRIQETSGKEGGGDEDGGIEEKLRELQNLLPGGEEMNVEEMLSEIGNYIKCLELQTIALKSIVQDTT